MAHTATNPIRAARERAGLSQLELAGQVGVTKGCISHWETGRSRPEPDRALALVNVLRGLRLDHIYRSAA